MKWFLDKSREIDRDERPKSWGGMVPLRLFLEKLIPIKLLHWPRLEGMVP